MEELQTDTLSDYGKNQRPDNALLDSSRETENGCAASLLNGCEEIDDPLDLMDHCDNVSIASNSDVWKGSDSEDESFEKRDHSAENAETNKENDKPTNDTAVELQIDFEEEIDKVVTNKSNNAVKADSSAMQQKDEKPEDNTNTIEEKDASKKDETEKTEEQGDSSVIESEDSVRTEKPDKSEDTTGEKIDDEGKEQQNEKETADSSKENQDAEIGASGVVNPEEGIDPIEKASADDTASTKPPVEVTEDVNADENRNSSEALPTRNEDQDEDCQMEYDADEDDDFDPSLLCPEVSMAVDDDPVVTTNGPIPDDTGPDSPLPYEPVFSTFVDDVTGAEVSFNLTTEEQELRKRMYGPTNPIQITKIHCTACNVHLGSALEGQNNRFVHPLLKVLICKECYHFYTSGEFEKDEDGSELYCRWCGQGGQVLCCSKCEYVFCKRCIRTNFGRKKMFEIRDSDSWDCFRCNQSQIITQRIACFEFFEYIRREMSRAATLNTSEIWSRDYTRCCSAKKRAAEDGEEVKKPKKRKEIDPDYNPLLEKLETPVPIGVPSTSASAVPITVAKGITIPKPIQIVPRYTANTQKDNDIEFVRQIPAPNVTIGAAPRPTYRTILPTHIRPVLQSAPALVRISSQPAPPLVPTSSRILGNALQNRNSNTSPMIKHEWFEKTVRAAARVNSHLSYNLTHLNKAQSQAASVEELAVVHNKLQEILSSSINSLIQIRKNLRTEFIAGIKTVRLPSKKVETCNNDDDVILVSAPATMSMPSTSQVKKSIKDPIIIIDKSPISNDSAKCSERPKGYLKVKSVMELQNVPSECITIPDDPPPPKLDEGKTDKEKEPSAAVCNGASDEKTEGESKESDPLATEESKDKESDPLGITPDKENAVTETKKNTNESPVTETIDLSDVPKSAESSFNKENENEENKRSSTPARSDTPAPKAEKIRTRRSKNNSTMYDVKSDPTADIKRMMSVKVHLKRDNLEEMQKILANRTE